ncbi:hypothetical protein LguiA_025588 [Lonicera macranthoides]
MAEHRCCDWHIYANLRKRYNGAEMRSKFWEACKTGTPEKFKGVIGEIYALDNGAHEYLMKKNPKTWEKAYFTRHCTYDAVKKKMCETFNGFILEARVKAIIYMLEEIRKSLMVRMQKKREQMEKWEGTLSLRAVEKLEAKEMQYRYWRTIFNGSKEFEVRNGVNGYVVDFTDMTCSCRMLGKPKKNRTRELHEDLKKNLSEISRKGRRMKCKKCGEYGHNQRTCRGPPNVKRKESVPNGYGVHISYQIGNTFVRGQRKKEKWFNIRGVNQMDKTLSVRGARISFSLWEVAGGDSSHDHISLGSNDLHV